MQALKILFDARMGALLVMEDDAVDLKEKDVQNRKVLVVDGDIVTGKAYKRSMEGLRQRKEKLQIKDIKFATYIDRQALADFSIWKYTPEAVWHLDRFDPKDLQIISFFGSRRKNVFCRDRPKGSFERSCGKEPR